MSRFSLYTLILVGTAVAVFTIGEYYPRSVAAPAVADEEFGIEMPSMPSAKKRFLPPMEDEGVPDRVLMVPNAPSVNLSVE